MADKLSPMQEELLKRADSIFGAISTAVGQAKDLAVEQLPDIAYQFIAYNRAYLTFIVLFTIVGWAGFQALCIWYNNKSCRLQKINQWDFDQWAPWFIGTFVTTAFFGIIFLNNVKDLFMVWFAPKIFLIEHLIQLVKH